MKCIIVDDDELSCLNLKRLCKKVDDLEVVAICNDGFEAINILKNKAEFKGQGDPFKSKNLYNVYFGNFFYPRNFNKTKMKKNINDYNEAIHKNEQQLEKSRDELADIQKEKAKKNL